MADGRWLSMVDGAQIYGVVPDDTRPTFATVRGRQALRDRFERWTSP